MASILIVDDDARIQNLLLQLLKTKHHDGATADGGVHALELLKQSAFDLVITDLRMPDMDGLELLRKVKSVQPQIPVILVTAYASNNTTIESVDLGVFDYLPKPFRVSELLSAVDRALEAARDKKPSAKDHYSGNNLVIREYLDVRAEQV